MIDIAESFKKFCSEIRLHSDEFETSLKEITKKLNKTYYDTDSEREHRLIVGSIGRGTAVEGVSDIDVIFENGAVRKNINYSTFKMGVVRPPKKERIIKV